MILLVMLINQLQGLKEATCLKLKVTFQLEFVCQRLPEPLARDGTGNMIDMINILESGSGYVRLQ